MSDAAKRDAVREEFFVQHHHGSRTLAAVRAAVKDAMADEIVLLRGDNAALRAEIDRLHRILAALREPSGKVLGAALRGYSEGLFINHKPRVVSAIVAAVAAAEQEVGRE